MVVKETAARIPRAVYTISWALALDLGLDWTAIACGVLAMLGVVATFVEAYEELVR